MNLYKIIVSIRKSSRHLITKKQVGNASYLSMRSIVEWQSLVQFTDSFGTLVIVIGQNSQLVISPTYQILLQQSILKTRLEPCIKRKPLWNRLNNMILIKVHFIVINCLFFVRFSVLIIKKMQKYLFHYYWNTLYRIFRDFINL